MTALQAISAEYLSHLQVERGLSGNTVAAYRRDLGRYLEFLAERGLTDADEVSEIELSEFVRSLGGKLAAASVARCVVAVRGLHRFALEERLATADPAAEIHPPKLPQRLPKALSVSQVQQILATPDPATLVGLRDAALLELLYGTGARVSEICDLDVDEVTAMLADEQAGLRLIGKGNKERVVPVGSYAREAVSAYLTRARPELAGRGRGGHAALLLNQRGQRLSRQSAWAAIQRAATAAGITEHISPHTLRHCFATHLLDGGADVRVVQELLGHASVATTQIYTLVTAESLREVYLAAHPRARDAAASA
ncbi:MAG: site-specific tyrosine recombinase XerD [Arachnia propionica]|nr:MAG: site-specific tyrosine recombinase XerD [Arachnia propionica]